ncbi:WecB/TagA/CpsF family glycosyltransferase [Planktomarina temperata]|nr:WecB/TagA/CpsF family glycosyltransferase [Planktomarina temperata]
MTEDILGYSVSCLRVDQFCERILVAIDSGKKSWLACFNPHSYAVSKNDAHFATALHSASWLVPDGIGVVLTSQFFAGKIKSRITGSDIFDILSAQMNSKRRYKVFFLGSSLEVLDKIQNRFQIEYPNIDLVGTFSPPFKKSFDENDLNQMRSTINSAKPDVLWVGLTAPKQEKWIFDNLDYLDVRFAGAIGAKFDFYAKTILRPPTVIQVIGCEWLYRLLLEPQRLWRRTLISAPKFIMDVILGKVRTMRKLLK